MATSSDSVHAAETVSFRVSTAHYLNAAKRLLLCIGGKISLG